MEAMAILSPHSFVSPAICGDRTVLNCDSSGEELLAGFSAEFAYLASRAELDHYPSCGAPWHSMQCSVTFMADT